MKQKSIGIVAVTIFSLLGFGCSESEVQEPGADQETGHTLQTKKSDPNDEPATGEGENDSRLWMSDLSAFSKAIVSVSKQGVLPYETELRVLAREAITLTGEDGSALYMLDTKIVPKTVTGMLDEAFAGKSIKWKLIADSWFIVDNQIVAVLGLLPPAPSSPENIALGGVAFYFDENPPEDVRIGDEFVIEGSITRRPQSHILGVVTAKDGIPPVSAYYGVGDLRGQIAIHAEITVSSWNRVKRGPEPEN